MYLVLLGPPGTGKGTQAKRIAERLGLLHIATGDMFREEVQQNSELGRLAKSYMDKGELVPDEVTIAMLEERIDQPDAREGAIFDGYPRTLEQARALDEALRRRGKAVDIALHVTASDDVIVRRLSGRWLCDGCGEIYHEQHRPPKQEGRCDGCDGQLKQRADDKPEVVRERLRRQRPSEELLAHYRDRDDLVDIDGEGDIDAVTRDLLAAIEKIKATVR
ncbi:MAG: adenylate kinase [Chloroflexi bacterium]|nr:adenylate kinase [Chloroflexota bacterium]